MGVRRKQSRGGGGVANSRHGTITRIIYSIAITLDFHDCYYYYDYDKIRCHELRLHDRLIMITSNTRSRHK